MAGQMDQLGAILGDQLMKTAQVMEEQVDAEMKRLETMDEDDLEILKRQRIEAMKKLQEKKQQWMQQAHGEYEEIPEEKEFFNVTKNSENVVCHFYREETQRCKIFDKHLSILAKKHIETKFCKIDAEKCPFLCDRLKIRTIPTLILVKDSITRAYVVGFTDLGNTDDFSTEMLAWRLGHAEVINYKGDLNTPPDQAETKKKTNFIGKKIKMGRKGKAGVDESSDEDDW